MKKNEYQNRTFWFGLSTVTAHLDLLLFLCIGLLKWKRLSRLVSNKKAPQWMSHCLNWPLSDVWLPSMNFRQLRSCLQAFVALVRPVNRRDLHFHRDWLDELIVYWCQYCRPNHHCQRYWMVSLICHIHCPIRSRCHRSSVRNSLSVKFNYLVVLLYQHCFNPFVCTLNKSGKNLPSLQPGGSNAYVLVADCLQKDHPRRCFPFSAILNWTVTKENHWNLV